MLARKAVVAGRFYPDEPGACREAVGACLAGAAPLDIPRQLLGGIVPHAGWLCSGRVAGRVFQALAEQDAPETIVLLGAVHRGMVPTAALYGSGCWETPLGAVMVDEVLAKRVMARCHDLSDAPDAHALEHSLEVQMPFVRALLPEAQVLPIMVTPGPYAVSLGRTLAEVLAEYPKRTAVVGTTDLTHYGPSYGFEPEGRGAEGVRWARDVNDRRMVELFTSLSAEAIVPEAEHRRNACGAGAAACVVAAVAAEGATSATVLEKTTSHDVIGGGIATDSVGYVGVVFGKCRPDKAVTQPTR